MIIKNTSSLTADTGVKILVYGMSGVGKTSLIPTLPRPIALSAEGGLLSITDSNTPYIEIKSIDDIRAAYAWLIKSPEAANFDSVALDSISEIAEVVLNSEKKLQKDPRKAYMQMQEVMTDLIRTFRDLPQKHVYFSAKAEKVQDADGRLLYYPSMPGNKLAQALPYFFDEVLALRVERDTDGNTSRALLTSADPQWSAKDRSGKLAPWEYPHLGQIINKIGGITNV